MTQPERVFPPSKYIKDALEERGWTQAQLGFVMGRSTAEITALMSGRRRISPEIAQELSVIFGDTPEYWLGLDSAYRLSQTNYVDQSVIRRSLLISFPVREMQKRGWINDTASASELEAELKRFFAVESLAEDFTLDAEGELPFDAAFKRTRKEQRLNYAERAWVARARQLAKAVPAASFSEQNLDRLKRDLRRYAAKSQAVHRVPEVLAKYGIRFVVVEPLKRVKIDGASFWLDQHSPVIALSIRFDNIGSFWFTLLHEIDHIEHKDRFSFDNLENSPEDEAELRANNNAAENLVPQRELDRFIKTYSPQYSKARINNLATKLQIHPGIIVGQLQHRNEISYAAFRDLMAKVRGLATALALTDGWGQPVPRVS